jgi:carbon-monoxide dehydrogenase iron sulfur subunit
MAQAVGIRVDAKKCRDCEACVMGCSLYHERECGIELARLKVEKDMQRYEFTIKLCKHCRRPKCLAACQDGAMYQDTNGVVHIIDEKCTRCGACRAACPFDAIHYHKNRNVYVKCDLCLGRKKGPLCVELCPVGALTIRRGKTLVGEERG